MMANLLIIDDNKAALTALELLFIDDLQKVILLEEPGKIPSVLSQEKVDVILLDMNFTSQTNTGREGIFWLRKIKEVHPKIPVIMITAFGEIELAVECMKEGAYDFILKPWKNDKIKALVYKAISLDISSKRTNNNHNSPIILGCSHSMVEIWKTIKKVAATKANILITGEVGTGKKIIAEEIHKLSQIGKQPSIHVKNGELASIFNNAINSEHTVIVERVDLLDEKAQQKIWDNINEINHIHRVISTSHSNLEDKVTKGQFRKDLYYEISTVQILVPPLRQRGNDIILLAEYFLTKFQFQYNKAKLSLSDEVKKMLLEYSWPSNVVELYHVIESAVILSDRDYVLKSDIKLSAKKLSSILPDPVSIEDMEKKLIYSAYTRLNGNLSAVANELKISRQTLYNKLKKYEI